jgi:two-component system response regulator QseB
MYPIMNQRRCLLVDDDPISAIFVSEWLAARGWQVAHADSLAAADRLLAAAAAEVWLVDRRLPDGDGIDWLGARLAAAGDRIPRCLVTSGEQVDPDSLPPGAAKMRKPLDLDALAAWLAQSTAASAADVTPGDSSVLLDDAPALARLGGNVAALRSLRGMLLAELEASAGWRAQLGQASAPAATLDALHRLRAGCLLTGCTRLGAIAEALETVLRAGQPLSQPSLRELDAALAATISALAAG